MWFILAKIICCLIQKYVKYATSFMNESYDWKSWTLVKPNEKFQLIGKNFHASDNIIRIEFHCVCRYPLNVLDWTMDCACWSHSLSVYIYVYLAHFLMFKQKRNIFSTYLVLKHSNYDFLFERVHSLHTLMWWANLWNSLICVMPIGIKWFASMSWW